MKRHVSAYSEAIIRLQSSKRINIVCVWRMLRSHHQAYKLYMRPKLRVSRYTGGRALLCGILAGAIPFGFCRCWPWGGGVRMAISRFIRLTLWERSKTIKKNDKKNDKNYM